MNKSKHNLILLILTISFLLMFVADVAIGSVLLSFDQLLAALQGTSEEAWVEHILWDFRIPKALSAVLVGAGLSVSGLLMQSLFRNPLAGPYVMGISSGASLGVAFFVLAGGMAWLGVQYAAWGMAIFAISGALLVLLGVLAVSVRIKETVSLLIIGIMFGSLTSAVVSILQYFSSAESVQSFVIWTFGSLGGVSWPQLTVMAIIVVAGLLFSFSLQKPLNTLLLSENYAATLGVSVKRVRLYIILITSVMAGSITAFTGPIVFVGVAVPHLIRYLFSTTDHRLLLPYSALGGALLMLICDLLSQLPGMATSLPINSITSIFGAPVIIWIIIGNKRKSML
jgi:iron complex transport system permease protein